MLGQGHCSRCKIDFKRAARFSACRSVAKTFDPGPTDRCHNCNLPSRYSLAISGAMTNPYSSGKAPGGRFTPDLFGRKCCATPTAALRRWAGEAVGSFAMLSRTSSLSRGPRSAVTTSVSVGVPAELRTAPKLCATPELCSAPVVSPCSRPVAGDGAELAGLANSVCCRLRTEDLLERVLADRDVWAGRSRATAILTSAGSARSLTRMITS